MPGFVFTEKIHIFVTDGLFHKAVIVSAYDSLGVVEQVEVHVVSLVSILVKCT